MRIKDGKIEDLTHMPLELTSKNARRKQAEASETRKFAPIVVPSQGIISDYNQSKMNLAQRHLMVVTLHLKSILNFYSFQID